MKLSRVGNNLRRRLADRRGQNTVEYLLMLTVIVGLVLVVGVMLKKFMPTMFNNIQQLIMGATNTLGSGN